MKRYFASFLPQTPPPNEVCTCGAFKEYRYHGGEWHETECENCAKAAAEKQRLEHIKSNIGSVLELAGVPARYRAVTINDMENLSAAAMDGFFQGLQGKSLVLHGGVGSGKTMLACCVLRELALKGKEVLFRTVPNLLAAVRSAMDETGKLPENVLREVITAEVIILDDLGAEYTTEWAKECIYRIVNDRYNEMRQTIYTSNFRPDSGGEIARTLGRRVTSRLAACRCIHVGEQDRRSGRG
ncbi:ATP-binding protein [Geovibrio ferrireducens]|uniref:ATP-binding protein n=1 Tax=Geovibrio ferrireducens TaxID=46201 RepID=UPI0022450B85|nr:ATP-binding protein [Geovibrio ferrireducens]